MVNDINCVGNQNRSTGQQHNPFEKPSGVTGKNRPDIFGRLAPFVPQFRQPLAGNQEKREQKNTEKQPIRDFNLIGLATGKKTQQKAADDTEEFNERYLFPIQGIPKGNSQIDKEVSQKGSRNPTPETDRENHQAKSQTPGGRDRDFS